MFKKIIVVGMGYVGIPVAVESIIKENIFYSETSYVGIPVSVESANHGFKVVVVF